MISVVHTWIIGDRQRKQKGYPAQEKRESSDEAAA